MPSSEYSCQNLAVGYGERALLAGVNLSLEPGDKLALTGPSGIGKSTLLRTLAGLIPPLNGDVRLAGRAPTAFGWPAFRRRVLYVHQTPTFHDGTVADALRRPMQFANVSAEYDDDDARRVLATLGLESDVLAARTSTLSGGQALRVSVARALLLEPDALLLDEPSAALDSDNSDRLIAALDHARGERGLTVVTAAHDATFLDRFAAPRVALQDHATDQRETA